MLINPLQTDDSNQGIMPDYFPGFPCNIYQTDFSYPLISNLATKWHWHDRIQIMMITHGLITVSIPMHQYELQPNMIMVIPPHLPHQITSENQGCYIGINLDLSLVSSYTSAYYQQIIIPWLNHHQQCLLVSPHHPSFNALISCFDTIIQLDKNPHLSDQPTLMQSLLKMTSMILTMDQDMVEPLPKSNSKYLYPIFDYIESNLNHPFSLHDIATAIGLSPSQLSRYFKSCCHINLFDYICKRRIEKSIHLLQNKSNSIQWIAHECGFTSSSYFIATFKKAMNCTPQQFRTHQIQKHK